MKAAHLIYVRYYDFDNDTATIGGVQTYIKGLREVFNELGYECRVYQTGTSNRSIVLGEGFYVQEIDTIKQKKRQQKIDAVVAYVEKIMDNDNDILVFMANEITCRNSAKYSIAIQHGISWDYLYSKPLSILRNIAHYAIKAKNSFKLINRLNHVKNVVCVDHNFPNWLRATAIKCDVNCTVIPNFTEIAPLFEKPNDRVNIIFARRLFTYRGTRVFAPAIANILKKYESVYVTVAGDGPDEDYIRDMLGEFGERVIFTTYAAIEAIDIHSDKHIAIVPTIGSEGTSLSCLEAMSAQCVPVCTDTGGLSNIVLDGFNGLFIERNSADLEDKISYLIENADERITMASNAYGTVKSGFSFKKWKERWKTLITNIIK